MNFSVDLEQYSGPIELLLYLVRRDELPIGKISLAQLTEQYISYLEVLTQLNLDDVAEFLEIASVLIEIKSKEVLPAQVSSQSDDENAIDDPSDQLVSRLLDYKRIRDAASILEEQGRRWQLRYSRMADDLPIRRSNMGDQPVQDLEVWDLVSAFGRILRENSSTPTTNITYDETPIHVFMQRIHTKVRNERRVELTSLFEPRMHKSTLVAMFLATLELARHYGLSTDQQQPGLPLFLVAGQDFASELDVHKIENLSSVQIQGSNLPVTLRKVLCQTSMEGQPNS